MTRLPIIRPDIRYAEVEEHIRAIFESGILTSGPYLERFERSVADYVGVAHAVATTSATTALHLSLAALGVGPGDEVLVSDFTFPATGNVVVQLGAVPVLVDSQADAFAVDVEAAASLITERTKAVIPVDPFGQPADLPAMGSMADQYGLAVIEDAACALGAAIDGRRCGSWPTAGCFSFHPRKIITTGEGGMVTTDDAALAARLRLLRNHGGERAGVGMTFVAHGFNYRLSEVQCALGIAQMARVDEILADRARVAGHYREQLQAIPPASFPEPRAGSTWTYQSLVVVLDDEVDRDRVVAALTERGIETTLGTYAMHTHPVFAAYGYAPGDLPNSWRWQRQSLTLPLLPAMTEEEVERVVTALDESLTVSASA
ncbi:MAG: DegT/DnrJ/EryC1/StrS family aminotransferase [Acidimicrobiia bacterium]|nr:DegT/DnrJ/EryC1/StrS family aminotransferase [Acidimicrobiia bacterium]